MNLAFFLFGFSAGMMVVNISWYLFVTHRIIPQSRKDK